MAESRKTPATLLTRREVQVLKGVAQGLSEREIALRLLIFEPAVREHIRSACQKLRVRARNGRALLRIGVVWNIPVACNRATADFLISSPLMVDAYERLVPAYGADDRAGEGSCADGDNRSNEPVRLERRAHV